MAARISWPIVALVGIVGAFFIGVFALIPKDMPELRTGLLGLLTSSVGAVVVVVVQRLAGQVAQIQQQTNGHMSTLLASKTTPDTEFRPVPEQAREGRHAVRGDGPW